MKISKTKKVIFSVAVAFVSVFFFAYAVLAVYPAPQYNDYCDDANYQKYIGDEPACVDAGGKWIEGDRDALNMEIRGYCDVDYYCNGEYRDAREPFERNVFFANILIGLVLLLGALFLALESVSSGLMGGGVMMMVYGSIRYWSELSNIWRTVILGVALVALIWVGYKKIEG